MRRSRIGPRSVYLIVRRLPCYLILLLSLIAGGPLLGYEQALDFDLGK